MKTIRSWTDATGHSVAEHVDRLRRTLDGLTARLRDAVAVAVGETLAGTVQATVRAGLAGLTGGSLPRPAPPRYGGATSSYWGDGHDDWGAPNDHRHSPAGSAHD